MLFLNNANRGKPGIFSRQIKVMKFFGKTIIAFSIAILMGSICEGKVITGQALLAVDAKQTKAELEEIALAYAKREALESAAVYIGSVSRTHMGVVDRDTVSTFVKGMARLKPDTLKKNYVTAPDGENVLHLQAAFDIDEKKVENMIEQYQHDKNVVWKFQQDLERFDSLLLKYEYLLRKQKRVARNKDVNVLSRQEKDEILRKLNTLKWKEVAEVCNLCVSYLKSQRFKEAVAVADLLIEYETKWINQYGDADKYLIENTGKTYAWRAQALYALERFDEADQDIEKSIEIYPENFLPINLKLDRLDKLGCKEEKIPYIELMRKVDPVTAEFELAQLYRTLKKYDLAYQAIERCILEESKDNGENHLLRMSSAYCEKAALCIDQNKLQEALSCFNQAISIYPYASSTYFGRGCLYEILQNADGALRDFTKAIELNTNTDSYNWHNQTRWLAKCYYNRAAIYSHLEKWQECLQDVNKAIELYPDQGHFFVLKREAEEKLRKH